MGLLPLLLNHGVGMLTPKPAVMLPTASEYLVRYQHIVVTLERVEPEFLIVDISSTLSGRIL